MTWTDDSNRFGMLVYFCLMFACFRLHRPRIAVGTDRRRKCFQNKKKEFFLQNDCAITMSDEHPVPLRKRRVINLGLSLPKERYAQKVIAAPTSTPPMLVDGQQPAPTATAAPTSQDIHLINPLGSAKRVLQSPMAASDKRVAARQSSLVDHNKEKIVRAPKPYSLKKAAVETNPPDNAGPIHGAGLTSSDLPNDINNESLAHNAPHDAPEIHAGDNKRKNTADSPDVDMVNAIATANSSAVGATPAVDELSHALKRTRRAAGVTAPNDGGDDGCVGVQAAASTAATHVQRTSQLSNPRVISETAGDEDSEFARRVRAEVVEKVRELDSELTLALAIAPILEKRFCFIDKTMFIRKQSVFESSPKMFLRAELLTIVGEAANSTDDQKLLKKLQSPSLREDLIALLSKERKQQVGCLYFNDAALVCDEDRDAVRPIAPSEFVVCSTGYNILPIFEQAKAMTRDELEQHPSVARQLKVRKNMSRNDAQFDDLVQLDADLLRGNCAHYIHIFRGSGGNCKSILQLHLKHLLGQYASPIPTTLLTKHAPPSTTARPDIARLEYSSALLASEPSKPIVWPIVFQLTGGDAIVVDNSRSVSLRADVILARNDLPLINVNESNGRAFHRRVRVWQMEVVFFENERDAGYDPKNNLHKLGMPRDELDRNARDDAAWYATYLILHRTNDTSRAYTSTTTDTKAYLDSCSPGNAVKMWFDARCADSSLRRVDVPAGCDVDEYAKMDTHGHANHKRATVQNLYKDFCGFARPMFLRFGYHVKRCEELTRKSDFEAAVSRHCGKPITVNKERIFPAWYAIH